MSCCIICVLGDRCAMDCCLLSLFGIFPSWIASFRGKIWFEHVQGRHRKELHYRDRHALIMPKLDTEMLLSAGISAKKMKVPPASFYENNVDDVQAGTGAIIHKEPRSVNSSLS